MVGSAGVTFQQIDKIIKFVIKDFLNISYLHEWLGVSQELKPALAKFKTYEEFLNSLSCRTDLSEDQKWMIEEKTSFIELAFMLRDMNGDGGAE